jgi:NhaP-type Na+/H+ or K+/H+ antiporter
LVGCTISWDDDFKHHTEGELFASIIEYILNCACFCYIGAWLPWNDFTMPELGISPWKLIALCIGVLALRRIPAIPILYKWVPEIKNWKEALHFGKQIMLQSSDLTVLFAVGPVCVTVLLEYVF